MEKKTDLFILKNSLGMTVSITNYGGRVVNLFVKSQLDEFIDVVLGFDQLSKYIAAKEPYFGANVGRYGNRIAGGKFKLDGKTYTLTTNNGLNHLHGGNKGLHYVVWDANQLSDNMLVLSYLSEDGEEGYPGNMHIQITYEVTEDNALKIDFEATTDQNTICNLTHHSFFNLNGINDTSTVNNHLLKINADAYTPVNSHLIPTGEIVPVAGTPFDFRKAMLIGSRLNAPNEQLEFGKGYDHNFVCKMEKDGISNVLASVYSSRTGIYMEVFSTEPGIQFYGGNFLDGKTKGKNGVPYIHRSALCLEPQHFPDSPNQPDFPSTLLTPNQTYHNTIVYQFSVK